MNKEDIITEIARVSHGSFSDWWPCDKRGRRLPLCVNNYPEGSDVDNLQYAIIDYLVECLQ
jgi:hypothetical protein